MTELAIICVFITIFGVAAIMYVEDWLIKVTAVMTIIGSLLILSAPLMLMEAELWIPSMIYLLQILQILIIGAATGFCVYRYNNPDGYSYQ